MRFNKLQAKHLFDGYRLLDNKVLVLKEDGTVVDIIDPQEAGDDVQQVEGILSPGYINCHCHVELSHLKGKILENTGLAGFVQQIVQKRAASEEVILQAIAAADQEMMQNGIVAVGDICNTTYTILQKQTSALYYHTFVEAMGAHPNVAEKNFNFYKNIYDAFISKLDAKQVSITAHAPYSISSPLLKKILNHTQNELFSIHNQETEAENLWFQNKTGAFIEMFTAMGMDMSFFKPSGKSSLQTYLPQFLPNHQVMLIHNVYTNEDDIQFAQKMGATVFWCLCPNANYYISRMMPPVDILIKNKSHIVLGTDSLASNYQLSIAEEINILRKYFPNIELAQMLQWATLNGAKALKIDKTYGSFEKGKKPGIAIFKPKD